MARELTDDGITIVAIHPGWVKTKMSGFTEHMGPDEAAERMCKVVDAVEISKTAKLYHRDGQELTW
jgi:NAD(P)-dependent dehydrogenase (short-subunit alcohol dehydrogenase family)